MIRKFDVDDERLSDYFMRRALEMLEQAKTEQDPIRRFDIEKRIACYWAVSIQGGTK